MRTGIRRPLGRRVPSIVEVGDLTAVNVEVIANDNNFSARLAPDADSKAVDQRACGERAPEKIAGRRGIVPRNQDAAVAKTGGADTESETETWQVTRRKEQGEQGAENALTCTHGDSRPGRRRSPRAWSARCAKKKLGREWWFQLVRRHGQRNWSGLHLPRPNSEDAWG